MVNIVLVEPEIPMNTGNIARTCAATRSRLHLVKPLAFDISDRAVKRAGLDYWHMVDITVYENLDDFFEKNPAPDLWLATTKAPRDYTQAEFSRDCWLMFGKETAGLPRELRERWAHRCIRIPMRIDARHRGSRKVVIGEVHVSKGIAAANHSRHKKDNGRRPQCLATLSCAAPLAHSVSRRLLGGLCLRGVFLGNGMLHTKHLHRCVAFELRRCTSIATGGTRGKKVAVAT